jgi:hypothetical protein
VGVQTRRTRYQDAFPFFGLRVVPEGREVPQTERLVQTEFTQVGLGLRRLGSGGRPVEPLEISICRLKDAVC